MDGTMFRVGSSVPFASMGCVICALYDYFVTRIRQPLIRADGWSNADAFRLGSLRFASVRFGSLPRFDFFFSSSLFNSIENG